MKVTRSRSEQPCGGEPDRRIDAAFLRRVLKVTSSAMGRSVIRFARYRLLGEKFVELLAARVRLAPPRDLKALKAALSDHPARRRRMAADLVELLSAASPAFRR